MSGTQESGETRPIALLVAESWFGNTLTIAQAVAAGLESGLGAGSVAVARAADAPHDVPGHVRLLLVGAPTHAMSLPREQSRAQAIEKGATQPAGPGVREWIEQVVARPDVRVVTFDTGLASRWSGSAAQAATKALRRHGFRQAERGPSFTVGGTEGPLAEGEEARAAAWGAELARDLRA